MEILIIHLSDLHIESDFTLQKDKLNNMIAQINNEAFACNFIICTISGDISYSGKQEEFINAKKLFDYIRNSISKKLFFAICPGNHDKNFERSTTIHEAIIDSIEKTREIDKDKIKLLKKCFEDYANFVYEVINCDTIETNEFMDRFIFVQDRFKIVIDGFNIVLAVRKDFKPRTAVIPLDRWPNTIKSDLNIALIHVSDSWFEDKIRNSIRNNLINNYNFVFLGHDHQAFIHQDSVKSDNNAIFIEGGTINLIDNGKPSEFITVKINTNSERCYITGFSNNGKDANFKPVFNKEYIISKKPLFIVENGKTFFISSEFQNHLFDIGGSFKHPAKQILSLDDIFIYPEVDRIFIKDQTKPKKYSHINMEKVVQNNAKIFFLGDDVSGKSQCAKKIFLDFISDNTIPILLEINQNNSIRTLKNFQKLLNDTIKKIYPELPIETFYGSALQKKVLIIDNFHLLNIKSEDKKNILKELLPLFNNIIIFYSSIYQFDILLTNVTSDKDDVIENFIVYEILPFGHKKRDELLNKWFSDDEPYKDFDNENIRNKEKYRHIFNNIVRNGFVPSYPFFLYTALSCSKLPNSNIVESTYGHYYTTLVNLSLMDVTKSSDEHDLFINYLCELAYKLFSLSSSKLSLGEWKDFHEWYRKEYYLAKPYDDILESLKAANLIQEQNDNIYFKYKYFYFYFLAKYLSSRLSDDETKKHIENFCETLHLESSANVLIFLLHLSHEHYIINYLISKASKFLADQPLIKLQEDSKFIEDIITAPPIIELDISTDNYNDENIKDLEFADDIDPVPNNKMTSGENIQLDNKNNEEDINFAIDVFKYLEIIGQILRSYHGSIPGDLKYNLCDIAYRLTSKSIGRIYNLISRERIELLKDIENLCLKANPSLREKRQNIARNYLYNMISIVTIAFIVKCSRDLGSPNLEPIFKAVIEKFEGETGEIIQLIDIAIKFNCATKLPFNLLRDLINYFKSCPIAISTLQWLTCNHIRTYKLNIGDKQKLCEFSGISSKSLPPARQQNKY